MAEGLQVFSSGSGVLQVNSDYRNIAFVDSFTVSIAANSWGVSSQISYVDTSYTYAYRAEPGYENVNCSMYLDAGRLLFIVEQRKSVVVRVYRFRTGGVANTNFGLEVFNAAGQLSFSSGNRYMKVLDFIYYGDTFLTSPAFTRSYNSRPAIYIGTLGCAGRFTVREPDGYWTWIQRFSTFSFSGNSFTFNPTGAVQTDEGVGGSPAYDNYSNNASSALVIDVSGL